MGDEQGSTFAEQLKRYREAAGLSQETLAERAGLSAGGVGALERGVRRTPQRQTVALLAVALGLTEDERVALEASLDRRRGPSPVQPEGLTLPVASALLPSGTVSFLFTDLEGSTRLLGAHPDAYRIALARHHDLLRATVETRGGVVFETVGDAVYAAFATPAAAVAAALAGQLALQREGWGAVGPLRARMGLHTGEAEVQGAHYFGAPLYRCGRLMGAAHGGQIVLSGTTAGLVEDALPDGAALRDLGMHRLRDVQRPERVFQLLHAALPADFAPLRSLDVLPHNLPREVTSFVGRETELREVTRLLATSPLLTLLGPGGVGKTRLALRAADRVSPGYPDRVWLVEFAGLADPSLVPRTVAAVLGVQEEPTRPLVTTLTDALRGKRLLLVLDNCEHLIGACAALAEALVRTCPDARLLATSREPLGIPGETSWRVPPLSLPDPPHNGRRAPGKGLERYEAVRLFVERATTVRPGFVLRERDAPVVAQVCRRLDGIPLAIELAAARLTMLTVEQLLGRLEDCFRLLTGGSRTALPRQQTLQATVEWSYSLLLPQEQALFARLAVFAGGWTLEAAEVVCSGHGVASPEVLDLLARLIDKSLVMVGEGPDGTARYRLLESLRRYGREQLQVRGETERLRARHAVFFHALVASLKTPTPEGVPWLDRLEAEHDNLRAALEWATDGGRTGLGLRLGAALCRFWSARGHLSEGREHMGGLLALPVGTRPPGVRARALHAAGMLALHQVDFAAARVLLHDAMRLLRQGTDGAPLAASLVGLAQASVGTDDAATAALLRESLAIHRAVGDPWPLAEALAMLGQVGHVPSREAIARELYEETLAVARRAGDPWLVAGLCMGLAEIVYIAGDYERAGELSEESLAFYQRSGIDSGVATALLQLGDVARCRGDVGRAAALYDDGIVLRRRQGSRAGATLLCGLAYVALHQGDRRRAAALFSESLALFRRRGAERGVLAAVAGLAGVLVAAGQPARAAQLLSAVETLLHARGVSLSPANRMTYEREVDALATQLDEPESTAARAAGRAMSLEQAIAYALEPLEVLAVPAE